MIGGRKIKWAGDNMHRRNNYTVLVADPEGMRLLERQQRRWVGNIKMCIKFRKSGCINLAQNRDQSLAVVKAEINFGVCKMQRIC
jgi:hypothetical protein